MFGRCDAAGDSFVPLASEAQLVDNNRSTFLIIAALLWHSLPRVARLAPSFCEDGTALTRVLASVALLHPYHVFLCLNRFIYFVEFYYVLCFCKPPYTDPPTHPLLGNEQWGIN